MATGSRRQFGMPSQMGEVMASLLMIVDAWYTLASEAAPGRYDPADRVEVLGQLVRLLARRFRGFRRPPRSGAVVPLLGRDSVGLRIRTPAVPADGDGMPRELAAYGFRLERVPGTDGREITLTCNNLAGARILPFPDVRSAARHASRRQ